MTDTMTDIVCLGEPLIEFNQQPSGLFLQGVGGDTSNVAVAAARQGARVTYVTRVGADTFGADLLELWQKEGITTDAVSRDETAPTGIYFVTHTGAGHEFTYLRRGSAASRLSACDIPAGVIETARVLHVSGISLAISESAADTVFTAIECARAGGVRVSFDSNLRLNLWPLDRARALIHAAMASADLALPGFDDACKLTGLSDPDAICDFYLRLGANIIALTLGRDGTLVATPDARKRIRAFPVDAVDATGAGDTFDGAFLAEWLRCHDPFGAAEFANATAALSTTGYGAVAPIPTRSKVQAFLGASLATSS